MVPKEKLLEYARERARPRFCLTVLSRFLKRVEAEASTFEDVERIYKEYLGGGGIRARVVG
jgi:hypothetical protein